MEPVKLCYPNEWSFHMDEDGFSWFLFSKKIWSPKGKFHYLEVSPHTRFYGETSGKTFLIRKSKSEGRRRGPKARQKARQKARLLLWKTKPNKKDLPKVARIVRERNLQGLVFSDPDHACTFPVCRKAIFFFLPEVLEPVKSCNSCPIIKFSRRNNSYLRKTIKNFPTCQEISKLLSQNSCPEVCRLLHGLLQVGVQ